MPLLRGIDVLNEVHVGRTWVCARVEDEYPGRGEVRWERVSMRQAR